MFKECLECHKTGQNSLGIMDAKFYLTLLWKSTHSLHVPLTKSRMNCSPFFTLGIIVTCIFVIFSYELPAVPFPKGQGLYLLSVSLVPIMVPDPQQVVDVTAIICSSINLTSHHAFNPLRQTTLSCH
jgi:hypothetical protein